MYLLIPHLQFVTLYVHESVLYVYVPIAALQIGSSVIFLLW